jgi:hypothetical protein
LKKEISLYPESKIFIDRILKMIEEWNIKYTYYQQFY